MQTNAEEIMALDQPGLIGILKDPAAPLFSKAKACQRLAVIGTKEAVPALAALLWDPQAAHYARFGLEPIPDPSVDDALRQALGNLQGRLRVGVIDSIGRRRDARAVDALTKLLNNSDGEVAQAAAAALGRIGGLDVARKLQKALGRSKAPVRQAVGEACLVCAEGLAAQGKRKEANALYAAVRRAAVPKAMQIAARQ